MCNRGKGKQSTVWPSKAQGSYKHATCLKRAAATEQSEFLSDEKGVNLKSYKGSAHKHECDLANIYLFDLFF